MQKSYSLYDGQVTVLFENRGPYHTYRATDPDHGLAQKVVPGATSVLGTLAKPNLVGWAAGKAAEVFIAELKERTEPLTALELERLATAARSAHRAVRDSAADLGKVVHRWVEEYAKAKIEGNPIPAEPEDKEVLRCLDGFREWEDKNNVEFVFSERVVYHRELQTAGTADLGIRVDGSEVGVADVKTSSTVKDWKSGVIYPEKSMQVSFYAACVIEEDKINGGRASGVPRIILHMSQGRKFEAVELHHRAMSSYANFEEDINGFAGLRAAFRRVRGY